MERSEDSTYENEISITSSKERPFEDVARYMDKDQDLSYIKPSENINNK